MKKWVPVLLLAGFFIFFFSGNIDAQCSQCKLMAEQSGSSIDDSILDHNGGSNINSAILYIMIVPYIMLSILFRERIIRFFKKVFAKTH
jgi:hypothetical protein